MISAEDPGPDERPRSSRLQTAQRWRARLRANPATAVAYRSGVGVVGACIVVIGVILIPLPGPGWLIVFIGLSVLASEFAWAERLLLRARGKVLIWTRWVSRQSRSTQFAIGASGVGLLAGAVAVFVATQGGLDAVQTSVFG